MKRVALSWSSGKDSAWALHVLRKTPGIEIAALITTFNSAADRVAIHAVRRRLAETQAERLGLPLWSVELPWPCANDVYEEQMRSVCERAVAAGITAVAFGATSFCAKFANTANANSKEPASNPYFRFGTSRPGRSLRR